MYVLGRWRNISQLKLQTTSPLGNQIIDGGCNNAAYKTSDGIKDRKQNGKKRATKCGRCAACLGTHYHPKE